MSRFIPFICLFICFFYPNFINADPLVNQYSNRYKSGIKHEATLPQDAMPSNQHNNMNSRYGNQQESTLSPLNNLPTTKETTNRLVKQQPKQRLYKSNRLDLTNDSNLKTSHINQSLLHEPANRHNNISNKDQSLTIAQHNGNKKDNNNSEGSAARLSAPLPTPSATTSRKYVASDVAKNHINRDNKGALINYGNFFLGLDLGFDLLMGDSVYEAAVASNDTVDTTTSFPNVFLFGLRAGYNYYFFNVSDFYIGSRVYFDAHFAFKTRDRTLLNAGKLIKINEDYSTWDAAANIDYLFHFKVDEVLLGLFLGFGLGWNQSNYHFTGEGTDKVVNLSGLFIPVNVGFNASFYSSHVVELGAKIPIQPLTHRSIKSVNNNRLHNIDEERRYIFYINYSYLF